MLLVISGCISCMSYSWLMHCNRSFLFHTPGYYIMYYSDCVSCYLNRYIRWSNVDCISGILYRYIRPLIILLMPVLSIILIDPSTHYYLMPVLSLILIDPSTHYHTTYDRRVRCCVHHFRVHLAPHTHSGLRYSKNQLHDFTSFPFILIGDWSASQTSFILRNSFIFHFLSPSLGRLKSSQISFILRYVFHIISTSFHLLRGRLKSSQTFHAEVYLSCHLLPFNLSIGSLKSSPPFDLIIIRESEVVSYIIFTSFRPYYS